MAGLAGPQDPDLLVGLETSDDAAVYRLSDELAVISTADFITPPVDDPLWFGQIAAANALSDIYAMGGRPLTALNLVMFPADKLDLGQLKEILRGGHQKVREAGASLAGGHSVDDLEPKYGLAVVGVVHPQKVLTNAGARPGDALVLTKPLGSGVLFNAVRAGRWPYADLEDRVLPVVAALNGPALETARQFDIGALTDITGFGLAGHALEVARASGVAVRLRFDSLPQYPGALEMYQKGQTTGSNQANRQLCAARLNWRKELAPARQEMLFDPQTSGGLLISLPAGQADALLAALKQAGAAEAALMGEVVAGEPGLEVV